MIKRLYILLILVLPQSAIGQIDIGKYRFCFEKYWKCHTSIYLNLKDSINYDFTLEDDVMSETTSGTWCTNNGYVELKPRIIPDTITFTFGERQISKSIKKRFNEDNVKIGNKHVIEISEDYNPFNNASVTIYSSKSFTNTADDHGMVLFNGRVPDSISVLNNNKEYVIYPKQEKGKHIYNFRFRTGHKDLVYRMLDKGKISIDENGMYLREWDEEQGDSKKIYPFKIRHKIRTTYLLNTDISSDEYDAILDTVFFDVDNQNSRKNDFKFSRKKLKCEEAKEQAVIDKINGKLSHISYGIHNGRYNYYVPILKNKYGINSFNLGDVVWDWIRCYNEVMDEKIKEIYGNNFWTEVDSLYDILDKNLYRENSGKIIFLDNHPSYKGGREELEKDLTAVLSKESIYEGGYYYFNLTINEDGSLSNVYGDKKLNKDDPYVNEYSEALKKLNKWQPAFYKGEPIQTEIFFKIMNVKQYK